MLITKGKSLRKWSQNGPDLTKKWVSRKPPPLFHGILVRRGGGFLDGYVLMVSSNSLWKLERVPVYEVEEIVYHFLLKHLESSNHYFLARIWL